MSPPDAALIGPTPPGIHLTLYVFDEMFEWFLFFWSFAGHRWIRHSNDGYGNTSLNEYIYREFIESSDSNNKDDNDEHPRKNEEGKKGFPGLIAKKNRKVGTRPVIRRKGGISGIESKK